MTAHCFVTAQDKARALALYERYGARKSSNLGAKLDAFFQSGQRRDILGQVGFASGKTVLDVGAGLGGMVRAAKAAGCHAVAIDAQSTLIDNLAELADEAYLADIETFSDPRTFDIVLCIGVLDFVLDPAAALRALATRVAPGGRLVLLVPTQTFFGRLYRLEKRARGFSVNLFVPQFCIDEVGAQGLTLEHMSRPLPSNVLFRFQRGQGGDPVRVTQP